MLGFNGGLVGKSNTPNLRRALSGVWTHREQVTARLANSWPQTPTNLANTYIAAVEAADGQSLETGVKNAYIAFVNQLYADGLIDSIVSACILCGARTLSGALVPLVGPSLTRSADPTYNRRAIVGTGSARLFTGINANDIPLNNMHAAVWQRTVSQTTGTIYLGTQAPVAGIGATAMTRGAANVPRTACRATGASDSGGTPLAANSLYGCNRTISTSFDVYSNGLTATITSDSTGGDTSQFTIFGYANSTTGTMVAAGSISFYSIGTSINLGLLSSAVQTLTETINSVVP